MYPSLDPLTKRLNPEKGYEFDKNVNSKHDAERRDFVFNGEKKQRIVNARGGLTRIAA